MVLFSRQLDNLLSLQTVSKYQQLKFIHLVDWVDVTKNKYSTLSVLGSVPVDLAAKGQPHGSKKAYRDQPIHIHRSI